MNLTQQRTGCFWTTDDEAALWLNEYGLEAPTTVQALNMHDIANCGPTSHLPIAGLELLAPGRFGEGRTGDDVCWTGASFKYGVYLCTRNAIRPSILILERNGNGLTAYHFNGPSAVQTWEHITTTYTPEMIWDICYQIVGAIRATQDTEANKTRRLLADKKVKAAKEIGRQPAVNVSRAAMAHGAR